MCRHVTKLVPHLVAHTECVDVPQEVCGVSKIKPVKKTRPAIKNWCFKTNITNTTTTTTQCPPGSTLNEETGECVPIQCPLGYTLKEETEECVPIQCPLGSTLNEGECVFGPGKTLLDQVVFFGFSSAPSGDVTTTMLIGRDNVKLQVPECQFTKTIRDSDIDRVGNVIRVNLEGIQDLGSYTDGKQCYQVHFFCFYKLSPFENLIFRRLLMES